MKKALTHFDATGNARMPLLVMGCSYTEYLNIVK